VSVIATPRYMGSEFGVESLGLETQKVGIKHFRRLPHREHAEGSQTTRSRSKAVGYHLRAKEEDQFGRIHQRVQYHTPHR